MCVQDYHACEYRYEANEHGRAPQPYVEEAICGAMVGSVKDVDCTEDAEKASCDDMDGGQSVDRELKAPWATLQNEPDDNEGPQGHVQVCVPPPPRLLDQWLLDGFVILWNSNQWLLNVALPAQLPYGPC